MNGRSDCVKVGIYLHANSQASSQGQLACIQAVTAICEDCEAIFLKGQKKENIYKSG